MALFNADLLEMGLWQLHFHILSEQWSVSSAHPDNLIFYWRSTVFILIMQAIIKAYPLWLAITWLQQIIEFPGSFSPLPFSLPKPLDWIGNTALLRGIPREYHGLYKVLPMISNIHPCGIYGCRFPHNFIETVPAVRLGLERWVHLHLAYFRAKLDNSRGEMLPVQPKRL